MKFELVTAPEKIRLGASPRPMPSDNAIDVLEQLSERGHQWALNSDGVSYYERILQAGFTRKTLPRAILAIEQIVLHQPISVRGVYYRVLQTGLVDVTAKEIERTVLILRRAGVVPFKYISDSTRRTEKSSSWSGLADYGQAVRDSYRKNFWAHMDVHLEVFCEKDAMTGVILPVTEKYDLPLNIIRGDVSDGFIMKIATTWKRIEKPIYAMYLGDFDPNGLDIERDVKDRLAEFSGREFHWKRIAVTDRDMADPSFHFLLAKPGDTRTPAYIDKWGWENILEVDAIEPEVIRGRLEDEIQSFIPQGEWERLEKVEEVERESFNGLLDSIHGIS